MDGTMETTPQQVHVAQPQRGGDPLPSCCEIPQGPDTVVFPRVLPRDVEADGKQTGSLKDHHCTASCAYARKEKKAGGQEADSFPFPLPKAGQFDKRTLTLGTQPVCCMTWWG